MFIKRFLQPFRNLQGKLTLSYTLTSVLTFILIELILLTILFISISWNANSSPLNDIKKNTAQAATYFAHHSPDHEELTSWLTIINTKAADQIFYQTISLSVVDRQGQTLASVGTQPIPSGSLIQMHMSSKDRNDLFTVLNTAKNQDGTLNQEADGTLLSTAPILERNGTVQGALVIKTTQPNFLQLSGNIVRDILVSILFITTIAALAGLVFGYLTARGLTRRLRGLSLAADRWSKGDFSALAHDTSEDELGQVARQFNRMADQLRNLLQARQKLATLEERNRLARDLHDSVKQQIFAVGMQIGAARILLKRDVTAAEVRLNETEKLVKQAQQELTSLISELRPVALEGKGLVTALRELTTQWAQQNETVANLYIEGSHILPLTVEEALFRVAQEALSNVARHSKATLVQLNLTMSEETITLSINDNGQGFDANASMEPLHNGTKKPVSPRTPRQLASSTNTSKNFALGVGLLSMQERMKALGGNIHIESTTGKGTRIIAHCPRLGIPSNDYVVSLKG